MASNDYPWIERTPDGEIDFGAIPDRLVRHPEILRRGIVPVLAYTPGVVFATDPMASPPYFIKVLNLNTEELPIYQRLLRELKYPNNHTLPSEITLDGHPLLIMPMLNQVRNLHHRNRNARTTVDILFQLVEGIDFLHSLHIVHMDMSPTNILGALPQHAVTHKAVVANRVYIIDFDSSRQFSLGPGVQRAITLPPTQIEPPSGLKHFDPYSWDVYCTGRTLENVVEQMFRGEKTEPHWIIEHYIQWLIGNERGCTGVCHCRPTARTALRVAIFLRPFTLKRDCLSKPQAAATHPRCIAYLPIHLPYPGQARCCRPPGIPSLWRVVGRNRSAPTPPTQPPFPDTIGAA